MKILRSAGPDPAGLNLGPYRIEIGTNGRQRPSESKAIATDSVVEKQKTCKNRLELQHTGETLSVFEAHFPERRACQDFYHTRRIGESAKWLVVGVLVGASR